MNNDITHIIIDMYNNWDIVIDIYNTHQSGKLFYDNQQRLFKTLDNGKNRMLDNLEYDILLFIQNNNINNIKDIDKDTFFNKYINNE